MSKKAWLLHEVKLLELLKPAADAAGRTSTRFSMKHAGLATIVVHIDQGNAATIALSIFQSQDVAGTGRKALANAVPIWANLDVAAAEAFTRQTDGVSFTTDAAVKQKQVVFVVDPVLLDVANGFDCVDLVTGASNAANLTEAQAFLSGLRYAQDTPPAARID